MAIDNTRSENLINAFKKHKIAASALRRIAQTIQGFEDDRKANWENARIGLVVVVLILAVAALSFFSRTEIALSF